MTSSVDIIIKLNHLVFSICTAQYSSKPTLKQFTNDRKCQWSFDFHLFSFWSTIICFSMIAIFSWMWRKNIMVCFSKVWSPTYDAELNHDFTNKATSHQFVETQLSYTEICLKDSLETLTPYITVYIWWTLKVH